jgi:hypothetical protein
MGEPLIVALGVHRTAEGDLVCDTVWVDAAVPAARYTMVSLDDGRPIAELDLPSEYAYRYGDGFRSGVPLEPLGTERTEEAA